MKDRFVILCMIYSSSKIVTSSRLHGPPRLRQVDQHFHRVMNDGPSHRGKLLRNDGCQPCRVELASQGGKLLETVAGRHSNEHSCHLVFSVCAHLQVIIAAVRVVVAAVVFDFSAGYCGLSLTTRRRSSGEVECPAGQGGKVQAP